MKDKHILSKRKKVFFLSSMALSNSFLFNMQTIESTKDQIYAQIQNIRRNNLADSITYTAFLPNNELIYTQYFTRGAGKGTFFCYLIKQNNKHIKLESNAFEILNRWYMENRKQHELST